MGAPMAANLVKGRVRSSSGTTQPGQGFEQRRRGGLARAPRTFPGRSGRRRGGPPCARLPRRVGPVWTATTASSPTPRSGAMVVVSPASAGRGRRAGRRRCERGFRVVGRAGVRRRGWRHRGGACRSWSAVPTRTSRPRRRCSRGGQKKKKKKDVVPSARGLGARDRQAAKPAHRGGPPGAAGRANRFTRDYGVDTERGCGDGRRAGRPAPCFQRKGATMLAATFKPGFRIALHERNRGIVTDRRPRSRSGDPARRAVAKLSRVAEGAARDGGA